MIKIAKISILFSMFAFVAANALSEASNNAAKNVKAINSKTINGKKIEAQNFAEYKAVAAALAPYIEAAKTGDGQLSRSAFYDHAHIVGSVGGQFYKPDADTFGKIISASGKSPDVQHHIAWIDISGPAAAAKVEFINWGGNRFTDFFVLYKHDGKWKISGKVYDSHSNN